MSKLLAAKMMKDCIELFNDEFIMKSQTEILPEYERISILYMANDIDDSEAIFEKQ